MRSMTNFLIKTREIPYYTGIIYSRTVFQKMYFRPNAIAD